MMRFGKISAVSWRGADAHAEVVRADEDATTTAVFVPRSGFAARIRLGFLLRSLGWRLVRDDTEADRLEALADLLDPRHG